MGDLRRTGGGYLLRTAPLNEIFTPEDLTDEHEAIARTTEEFLRTELASGAPDLAGVLRRSADLGLTAILIPERFGGMDLDLISAIMTADRTGAHAGFALRHLAHSGPAVVPLLWFGSEALRDEYLPKIASGEMIAAAAMDEGEGGWPFASSVPAENRLLLNARKLRAVNARDAGCFTVMAELDGRLTVLLVDRKRGGVHVGTDGTVDFDSVQVSADAVVGEIGGGAAIAAVVNSLERMLFAAAATGALRVLLKQAIRRTAGAAVIARQHLAELAISLFSAEAVTARVAGMLSEPDDPASALKEHLVESTLARAVAFDSLESAFQEAGNVRYWSGGPVATHATSVWRHHRFLRDGIDAARLLLEGARRGALPLPAAVTQLRDAVVGLAITISDPDISVEAARATVNTKAATLLALGAAFREFGAEMDREPEVLAGIGRLAGLALALESTGCRASRLVSTGGDTPAAAICRVATRTTLSRVEREGGEVLSACGSGDTLRTDLGILRRLTRIEPVDLIGLRKEIGEHILS